jgi:nucleotide-binding universal stress UspA family protein
MADIADVPQGYVISGRRHMASTPDSRTVLVGADGSEDSRAAVRKAAELCSAMNSALRAVFVRHTPTSWWLSKESRVDVTPAYEGALDETEERVRRTVQDDLKNFQIRSDFAVRGGDPADTLMEEARLFEAVAIVVGGRGHRLRLPAELGSVADKLVKHSPISVLVVRSPSGT